jgi:hypothetical protein
MSTNDLKLYALNTATMALSFTNIENTLKIVLLCISIIYTILKTIDLLANKKNKNETE